MEAKMEKKEFKLNEFIPLNFENIEVLLDESGELAIPKRDGWIVMIRDNKETTNPIWDGEKIFRLLEDGIKFRKLQEAEKIKKGLKT